MAHGNMDPTMRLSAHDLSFDAHQPTPPPTERGVTVTPELAALIAEQNAAEAARDEAEENAALEAQVARDEKERRRAELSDAPSVVVDLDAKDHATKAMHAPDFEALQAAHAAVEAAAPDLPEVPASQVWNDNLEPPKRFEIVPDQLIATGPPESQKRWRDWLKSRWPRKKR